MLAETAELLKQRDADAAKFAAITPAEKRENTRAAAEAMHNMMERYHAAHGTGTRKQVCDLFRNIPMRAKKAACHVGKLENSLLTKKLFDMTKSERIDMRAGAQELAQELAQIITLIDRAEAINEQPFA